MTDDTTSDRHPGGRPTKLTEEFLGAMMEVLNDGDNALIYTDEELLFLINDRLPAEARISGETLRRWKKGDTTDDVMGQKFCGVYTRALLRQKASLFRKLDDPQNARWQKDAWKIERKFGDWNIKHQVSVNKAPEDGAAALAAALLGGDASGDAGPTGPIQTAAGTDAAKDS
jgi:hypothetical protein